MEIGGVDPAKLNALIVSHGHYDHFGGLLGFLEKFRDVLPADVKLYAGGEDNFCHRYSPTATKGQFTRFRCTRPAPAGREKGGNGAM